MSLAAELAAAEQRLLELRAQAERDRAYRERMESDEENYDRKRDERLEMLHERDI